MRALRHLFAAVYETRLIDNEKLVISAPPVKIDIITGPAYMYRLSNHKAVVPLRGQIDEKVEIPPPPPIDFEDGKRYVVISTQTTENPATVEDECHRIVDRISAILGLLSTPTIFAVPMYVGWVSPNPGPPLNTDVLFSKPEKLHRSSIEKGVAVARNVLAKDAATRDRFDLIARLFTKAIGAPPSDEAFLWSWMCLEVFPMMGSNQYRHIAPYLAKVTGQDESELARRLDIRALHGLRSKLVHSGHLGLSRAELYTKINHLRGIVYTVMRGMCGLPYDGEIERIYRAGL